MLMPPWLEQHPGHANGALGNTKFGVVSSRKFNPEACSNGRAYASDVTVIATSPKMKYRTMRANLCFILASPSTSEFLGKPPSDCEKLYPAYGSTQDAGLNVTLRF